MSEFFLELFTEEVPSKLQKNARKQILELFRQSFNDLGISYIANKSYSTPKRLVIFFDGIKENLSFNVTKARKFIKGYTSVRKLNDDEKKNLRSEGHVSILIGGPEGDRYSNVLTDAARLFVDILFCLFILVLRLGSSAPLHFCLIYKCIYSAKFRNS